MNNRSELTLHSASSKISLPHCSIAEVPTMKLTDSALNVMTDLTKTPAFSIGLDKQVDHALLYMKTVGVKLLFVLDQDGGLAGLVTAYNIMGEKPMLYLQSMDCNHTTCTRSDVRVKNVMIPTSHWEVINYSDIQNANIAQIVAAFKAAGRRHLVVKGNSEDCPKSIVHGIFSASRVEQVTSLQLEIVSTARSFAEIETALAHS